MVIVVTFTEPTATETSEGLPPKFKPVTVTITPPAVGKPNVLETFEMVGAT